MKLTQLTDVQLIENLNGLATVFLASCELDHDMPELESRMDAHYHEANRRGLM